MSNNLTLVEDGIERCGKLKTRFPNLPVLDSIAHQLQYLKSVLLGVESDRSRLNEIIIGVQTARGIESLDMQSAEVFYRISDLAKSMKR